MKFNDALVTSGGRVSRRALPAMLSLVAVFSVRPDPNSTQAADEAQTGVEQPALGHKRIVRFRVTEGTWISLDISPDGRTIIFDLLGDLYTLPFHGGTAHPLTSGAAFDAQPRFSPDGRYVAFVSDRSGTPNLWVMDRHGHRPKQISHLMNVAADGPVSSPAWAPDNRTVIVAQRLGAAHLSRSDDVLDMVHDRRWLLATYDIETAEMRWLSDTSLQRARRTLGPVVAPDGQTVYAAVEPYRTSLDPVNAWRLGRIDFATGEIVPMTAPGLGRGAVRPAVSRDGRLLAYLTNSGSQYGIRLLDLETLRERWLVRERLEAIEFPYGSFDSRDHAPGYAFTPDGKGLIAAVGGKIRRIDVATGRISTIPFIVDVVRELAPMTVHQFTLPDTAVPTRSILQPALSPDGSAVAFSFLDRVWVMDLPRDGKPQLAPRRLTRDTVGEFYPSWSPDGRWVAYSTWNDGEGGDVRRVPICSGHGGGCGAPEQLTSDRALYFHTAFSTDGNRIVVIRADPPQELFLTFSVSDPVQSLKVSWLPATGGHPTPVTDVTMPWGPARLPVEQLYFTNQPNRVYLGLDSYDWQNTERRAQMAVADSETSIPSFNDVTGVVSPDGKRALVTHRWALSEVTLAQGAPRAVDTLDLERAQTRRFGSPRGAASRWGRALAPWISWSRNGKRVLFAQGGTLFVGDVHPNAWTTFVPLQIPLSPPVDIPRGTLVLRGARLITMHNDRNQGLGVIEHGDLVVRDNRVVAVGPAGSIPLPAGAWSLDVTGKTILPGYVDTHDHSPIPYGIHGAQCWACLTALAYGITAVRDPAALHMGYGDALALRERERAGLTIAPRVFSSGIPHYRDDRPIQTLADARDIVRPLVHFFHLETLKDYTIAGGSRMERRLVAQAAAEAGLDATTHSEGVAWGLKGITDGFSAIEHTFTVRVYDDVLTFIARSGITHTNTYGAMGGFAYSLSLPRAVRDVAKAQRFLPTRPRTPLSASTAWTHLFASYGTPDVARLLPILSSAAGIMARGGCVGIGSHADFPGIGYHYEMWLHALGGMSNSDILRAATVCGAAAIGHSNDFGSLEAGKLADLQILDDNPLDDIHHSVSIRYVMKNGRLYCAEDLTEVWPRRRPLLYAPKPAASTQMNSRSDCPWPPERQPLAGAGSEPKSRPGNVACATRPGRWPR